MIKRLSLLLILLSSIAVSRPVHAVTHIRAATPTTIQIPYIHVTAQIEARGLTSRGVMRAPTTSLRVAWDQGGVIPGNPGTAVMYGHLTDEHFQPAIFFHLQKLRLNDRVVVTDIRGTKRTFKVIKKKVVAADKLTYVQVAQATQFIHLSLYTCAGHWVQSKHRYSDYLVVYTSLVSVTPKR